MSKHLKHLLEGARQVLVLAPDTAYIKPSRNDFKDDVKTLRQDANRIVRALNKTTKQYGK